MTTKQRLLAALRGEPVDRIPFSPNLAYWIAFQPNDLMHSCEVELIKKMGADPMIRGHYPNNDKGKAWEHVRVYDTFQRECSITEEVTGTEKITTIHTPAGDLHAKRILTPQGNSWFLTEHPVKSEEDLAAVRALFDDMVLEPNTQDYDELCRQYGEEALLIPMLVPEINMKSGFQSLVEFWLGTEQLAYAMMDYPEEIEKTLVSMRRVSRRAAELSAMSNAECFITWEDTSTTNISPSMYREYILPELNEWSEILGRSGKMYMQHACGHLDKLLDMMSSSKISGIESLSPAPTGNVTMADARRRLARDKFIVGGIEPVVFESSTMDELEKYTKDLLKVMEGYPFVLANSDSCPPRVTMEKFQLISDIVRGKI